MTASGKFPLKIKAKLKINLKMKEWKLVLFESINIGLRF